jgi:hypothetical protein
MASCQSIHLAQRHRIRGQARSYSKKKPANAGFFVSGCLLKLLPVLVR